jgi:hypothetical protein
LFWFRPVLDKLDHLIPVAHQCKSLGTAIVPARRPRKTRVQTHVAAGAKGRGHAPLPSFFRGGWRHRPRAARWDLLPWSAWPTDPTSSRNERSLPAATAQPTGESAPACCHPLRHGRNLAPRSISLISLSRRALAYRSVHFPSTDRVIRRPGN